MLSAEQKQARAAIVHGAFVKEGTMIAFPTCFPGMSTQVPADESRITALAQDDNHIIYAGTSGHASHLLAGMFHGITGMVLDMGIVAGAVSCPALCCTDKEVVAAVNGPAGGRLVKHALEELPFDLIQEWNFSRVPFQYSEPIRPSQKILHAVMDTDRQHIVGITESCLFLSDPDFKHLEIISDFPCRARLALTNIGTILGLDTNNSLWCLEPRTRKLHRKAIPLPAGQWDMAELLWSKGPAQLPLYLADAAGAFFRFGDDASFQPVGSVPIAPCGPMAVTHDGRLFGTAGTDIAHLFCYKPENNSVSDLGAAVSVFERRRYGYNFGDALTGRDGEIIFGENDDLGHIWLYFPKIEPQ